MALTADRLRSHRPRREPLRARRNAKPVMVTVRTRTISNPNRTTPRSSVDNHVADYARERVVSGTVIEAAATAPLPAMLDRLPERRTDLAPLGGTSRSHPRSLDGLRGLAAIGAFLYFEGHLRGGFVGIDLFLAVTGFAATRAVLARYGTELADIVRAASDRALAAAGPVVMLLACAALYGAYVATAPELPRLQSEAITGVFLVSNWHAALDANLLSGPPLAPSFLGHLWVLALVAQVALAWMLFVAAFGDPVGRRRRLTVAAVSLAGLSAIAAYYFGSVSGDPARAFFGTDSRATSFLLGAAVASWQLGGPVAKVDDINGDRVPRSWRLQASGRTVSQLVAIGALGSLVWLSTSLRATESATYASPLAGAALASAVVVWAATRPQPGLLVRVVSWKPLAVIGMNAYGAYLFYLPVVAVVDSESTMFDGWRLSILRAVLLVSAGVLVRALLSESPGAVKRTSAQQPRTFPGGPLLIGMAALIAVLALVTGRSPLSTPAGDASRVLVLGDQMAGDVADGLAMNAGGLFAVFDRSIDGCGIFSPSRTRVGESVYNVLPECQRWVSTWTSAIAEIDPDVAVISAGEWDATSQELAGQWIEPCDPEFQAHYMHMLGSAVDIVSAQGASVVLVTARNGDDSSDSWAGCVNDVYRSFASSNHDRVVLVDIGGYLCPNGRCQKHIGGRSIVTENGVDLNDHGKRLVSTWLEPRLAQAAKT